MLQEYIDRELLAKNRSVYFKKGKWVFHLVCLIAFWLVSFLGFRDGFGLADDRPGLPSGSAAVAALVSILPFCLFFYVYCIHLIPVYFKQRRYRRFWASLALLILTVPWVEEGLNALLRAGFPGIAIENDPLSWSYLLKTYRNFLTAFLGFTTVLFLMELMEGVRTVKETGVNTEELDRTEVQLLKTRMNPDFINRSLDDIIAMSAAGMPQAPDAVVHFSDVLRYRLYRSGQPRVRLSEELQQLGNLFRLQYAMPAGAAVLEIEGENRDGLLTPMLLLNIAESLLATYSGRTPWSLHFFVLVEDAELQIAIELQSAGGPTTADRLTAIHEETERICGSKLTFAIEQSNNEYSIRICLPIQRASAA